ncbi:type IX secretion system membrane protein PorP/SprF [soil metagenome]
MNLRGQKKIVLTISLLVACYAHLFAQQDPLSTQYLNNYFLINPAYAGLTKDINLSIGYRTQWAGISGSPVTYNATGHISVRENKVGIGFSALQDKIGADRTTEFNAAYSYRLPLSDGAELSFGVQGGVINYQTDYSDLQINPNDLKFQGISEFKANFGAGVLVRSESFLFSVAVPHLLPASNKIDSLSTRLYAQNLYIFGGYILPVSYRVKLKPSILLRAVKDAAVSVDYALAFKVDDSYSLGVITRNFSTLGFQAIFSVGDAFRLGYTFEMPLNSSTGLNFSSHEMFFGMRIKALKYHNIEEIKSY